MKKLLLSFVLCFSSFYLCLASEVQKNMKIQQATILNWSPEIPGLTLSWTPAIDEKHCIKEYKVYLKPPVNRVLVVKNYITSINYKCDLLNNTTYQFVVWAINKKGQEGEMTFSKPVYVSWSDTITIDDRKNKGGK